MPVAVVRSDEQAARPLKDVAEFLAREADRRGVDQRLHFVDVVAQHAKVEGLVAVVQRVERDEFLQRIGHAAQSREHAYGLLFLGVDMRRQKAAQIEFVALRFGKSGTAVERGVAQQRETGWHCVLPAGIGFVIHGQWLLCPGLSLLVSARLVVAASLRN